MLLHRKVHAINLYLTDSDILYRLHSASCHSVAVAVGCSPYVSCFLVPHVLLAVSPCWQAEIALGRGSRCLPWLYQLLWRSTCWRPAGGHPTASQHSLGYAVHQASLLRAEQLEVIVYVLNMSQDKNCAAAQYRSADCFLYYWNAICGDLCWAPFEEYVAVAAGAEDPWEKVEWGRKLQHYPTVEEFVAFPGVMVNAISWTRSIVSGLVYTQYSTAYTKACCT